MTDRPAVTVYTAPNCMGCVQTKRHLDRRGVAYTEVPIDDDNREAILFLGYTSAPVVCANIAGAEHHWSGYRPDRLDAIAKAVAEQPTLLQPFPAGTPTDAELQAQRDADHAREIAEWEARGECLCGAAVRMAGKCLCGAR